MKLNICRDESVAMYGIMRVSQTLLVLELVNFPDAVLVACVEFHLLVQVGLNFVLSMCGEFHPRTWAS